ncbi:MAG: two-component sensor histidine kinase [Archangiaceae bacterium]|nr:two-component sensor histidine kinase [Archangiaceae bacterium]
MKIRVASISFLLAAISVGASWLSLQPSLAALLAFAQRELPVKSLELVTRVKLVLPVTLAMVLVAVAALTFAVIHFTVGRPLARTEKAIEQLGRLELNVNLDSGGPLLSRLQRALVRMADAVQTERAITFQRVEELKQTNDKLMRAQAELLASDRLATVGKLAAGVAHEVGNPLSGILGYLSIIQSRAKGQPEMVEIASAIENEVTRIDQIVRSLLDLGRPSRGKPMPLEVGGVLHAATRLVSKGPELTQVTVTEEYEPGLVVLAESGPLSQVVINLVLNAAQAMEGKGSIAVRAHRRGEVALIEVQDTGPGLTPEAQARLFEPFFTTKTAGKGTGLGLAVSQHLLTAMGGKLRAENAPAGGALFTLELPVPH